MRVALIGCVKGKRRGCHKAKDIYTSVLFRYAWGYANDCFGKVFILSAKHGLLDPDKRIKNYDTTLNGMCASERRVWSKRVAGQICQETSGDDEIHFFCGRRYRETVIDLLEGRRLFIPLEGLGIGEQLKWYKSQKGLN